MRRVIYVVLSVIWCCLYYTRTSSDLALKKYPYSSWIPLCEHWLTRPVNGLGPATWNLVVCHQHYGHRTCRRVPSSGH